MSTPAKHDEAAVFLKPKSAEGLRLIKAFLEIPDPAKRILVIELAEQLACSLKCPR
jgi:hypothetical protein